MRSDRSKKRKRKSFLLKFFLKLLLLLIVAAGVLLGALTLFEYKPDDREILSISGSSAVRPKPGDTIKILSWNIGYGALGDNASYFLDGGSDVITSDEARVNENMQAISNFINSEQADIMLLQEVDHDSKRSHGINESHYILRNIERSYTATFAINYKALYIPYPIPPLGKMESGLLTVSAYDVNYSTRVSLPCPYDWPMRLINLKRCLMVDRIPVQGSDKDLIVINLHLEAYADAEGQAEQIQAMMAILEEEYAKGNYVIAGGDFNQTFSNVDLSKYPQKPKKWAAEIVDVSSLGSNWTALMDDSVPSCRLLDQPYLNADPDSVQYYVLDGFIVSNNLKVESFHTEQLNFVNSDHNPVILEVNIPAEAPADEMGDNSDEPSDEDGDDGEDNDDDNNNG